MMNDGRVSAAQWAEWPQPCNCQPFSCTAPAQRRQEHPHPCALRLPLWRACFPPSRQRSARTGAAHRTWTTRRQPTFNFGNNIYVRIIPRSRPRSRATRKTAGLAQSGRLSAVAEFWEVIIGRSRHLQTGPAIERFTRGESSAEEAAASQ